MHLQEWPAAGAVDQQVVDDMALLRQLINEASQRAAAGVKVRQPLALATVAAPQAVWVVDILAEGLNVKR